MPDRSHRRINFLIIHHTEPYRAEVITTSQDILCSKARHIWETLYAESAQRAPEFSNRWLQQFQHRHDIRQQVQHGEAGSVPTGAEELMRTIQDIARSYSSDDIYNMDETALYWRKSPSRGLSTVSMPGKKRNKSCISIALCTNASRSDRGTPWLIGNAKQPRAFRDLDLSVMGVTWRYNKKA